MGKNSVQREGKRIGLSNLKNTCYLNAAVQGLQSCTLLREAIIKAPVKDWKESRLTRRMKVLFLEMANPYRHIPWAPEELFNEICTWEQCVKWKEKSQEDAGELITCLIEKLSEENKTAGKLFSAAQVNTTKCKNCKEETASEEKFQTIELNIDGSESDKGDGEKEGKAIGELLRRYSEWETLTKNNEYECVRCGKHQEADRKTMFVFGPKILVMQLKRFKKKEENGITTVSKLTTKVKFQEELRLPCQLSSVGVTANYKVKAVIEHKGPTASNGHYVAYVREGNQWIEWNDETGESVTWAKVENSEAYILFWEKIEEEGAQNYEEDEWTDSESVELSEEVGEEGRMKPGEVGLGNGNKKMDIVEVEGHKKSPMGKKRRLSVSLNTLSSKIIPKGILKRRKRDEGKGELKEISEVARSTTNRNNEPRRRKEPQKFNKGDKSLQGDECCREDDGRTKPQENKRGIIQKETELNKMETESNHALKEVVGKLWREIEHLKEVVGELRKENGELKLRLTLWERKNKLEGEEAAEWRNEDDRENWAAEGSPTPVWRKTREPNTTRSILKKNKDKENFETEEQRETLSEINTIDHARGMRMEIDDMPEKGSRPPEISRSAEKEVRRKTGRTAMHEIPHRAFLEDCFQRQIGLPIHKRQTKTIYSFTDKKVAKGYTKVVTTCQGMYYEMEWEQVNWDSFKDRKITIDGDWCWRSWGVTVYNPARDRTIRTVVPHRFAIKPKQNTMTGSLRTDRYYIHVYQTKIGTSRRTLSSKGIARELNRRFREVYMPRKIDIQNSPRRGDRQRRDTGNRDEARKEGTWRETSWRETSTRKKDSERQRRREDENGRKNSPVQRKNWERRTQWKPRGEIQRERDSGRVEHRWREEEEERGKTDLHKLGEKLDKITRTLEILVQRERDF